MYILRTSLLSSGASRQFVVESETSRRAARNTEPIIDGANAQPMAAHWKEFVARRKPSLQIRYRAACRPGMAVDSQWALCIACFVACRGQAVGPGPCTGPIAVRLRSCSIRECSFSALEANLASWRSRSCHVLSAMTSALRSGRRRSSNTGRSEARLVQKLPFDAHYVT